MHFYHGMDDLQRCAEVLISTSIATEDLIRMEFRTPPEWPVGPHREVDRAQDCDRDT